MAGRGVVAAWRRAPPARRRLALEAVLALLHARAVTLLPPRLYARHLGAALAGGPQDLPRDLPEGAERQAREIGRMVERVAAALPLLRLVCLQQAIAARRMLARRGIPSVLHLGMVRDPEARAAARAGPRRGPGAGDAAHAWLRCGAVAVTGGEDVARYAVVGRFV